MGLDLMDMTFRAERSFKIRMPNNWVERLGIVKREDDATLEEFHRLLLHLCSEQQVEPPENSWDLVVKIVEDATGFDEPKPTTTLREVAPYG